MAHFTIILVFFQVQFMAENHRTETTEMGLTRVMLMTEIDFGGVIPKSVMLRMSAMNMPMFIKHLSQGLLKDASI